MDVEAWRLKHRGLICDYTGQHDCRDKLAAKRLTSVDFESESANTPTLFLVELEV